MGNLSVKLKDIYFGIPDGAAEAQNENFEELFYDQNNKYEELMNNNEKFLVIGSKGTGKTYLAHYAMIKSPKTRMKKMVDANDFSIYKLANLYTDEINNDLIYALCKWFLLDKIAHMLIEKHKIKSFVPLCKMNRLKKIVEQYDNDDFFKIMRKTGKKSIDKGYSSEKENDEKFKRNANIRSSEEKSFEAERKKFFELINTYENLIFKCFSKKDDLLLIIDDLDEIEKDKDKIGDIIINLIRATQNYNFKSCKGKKKIILLLRTDILNELQGQNANINKIKTSCSVELYWLFDSMTDQYKHPLMSMVLHKIKVSCPQLRELDNKKLFMELFPEKINSKPPLDYLLDYGFGRPRDIITFLNHTKNICPEDNAFSAVALKEARKLYSDDFYNEMLNQASFYKKKEFVKECLNLLAAMKQITFSYEEIKKVYMENSQSYTSIEDIDSALTFLYKIGAIGNVWKANKKSHSCWAYKKDAMDDVDLSKKFTIHYGLRKKFSI